MKKKKALGERAGEYEIRLAEMVRLNFENGDMEDFPLDDEPPEPEQRSVEDIRAELEALEREAVAKEEAERRERKKEFWKEIRRNAIVAFIASLAMSLLLTWLDSR